MACFSILCVVFFASAVLGSTHVSRISEEFVAKPNGQTATAKAVMVGLILIHPNNFSLERVVGPMSPAHLLTQLLGVLMSIGLSPSSVVALTMPAPSNGVTLLDYVTLLFRPEQASYLFFMHFSASFESSAKITSAEVFVRFLSFFLFSHY
jgi:hypothetical protein